MAQSDRAPLQQTQELAARRDPIRQNEGILSRLRRHRSSQTMEALCPRALILGLIEKNNRTQKNHKEIGKDGHVEQPSHGVSSCQFNVDKYIRRLSVDNCLIDDAV
jgi:hypothetical protein